jgi:hypothetical protein
LQVKTPSRVTAEPAVAVAPPAITLLTSHISCTTKERLQTGC